MRASSASELIVRLMTFTLAKEADRTISRSARRQDSRAISLRFDPISVSTVVLEAGPIPAGTYFFLCGFTPR
jgi:hypothetical protein